MTAASPAAWDAVRAWSAETAGLELTADLLERLRAYVETLLFWNRTIALVSQNDPGAILAKHVADSLVAAAHCGDHDRAVDLGSGAGFPGLVIAIVRPHASVALVESRGKKVSFLEEAIRAAGASNARVHHARIEALARHPDHRGRYAIATARALTDLSGFLALATPFLAPGGRALAMRADSESTPSDHPPTGERRYTLPDGTPRRLLTFAAA